MLSNHHKTVSVIVPVYNEAKYIRKCLQSLLNQTIEPLEIIVVDNNSSDDSLGIVESLKSPLIKIIKEPKQGIVYARNAGLNAAKGKIILRTDADSYADKNWVESMLEAFDSDDVMLVAGRIKFYDVPLKWFYNKVELAARYTLSQRSSPSFIAAGANMGIRRAAWLKVKPHTCFNLRLHEDIDLSLHVYLMGYRSRYVAKAVTHSSGRRLSSDRADFEEYINRIDESYELHDQQAIIRKVAASYKFARVAALSLGGVKDF